MAVAGKDPFHVCWFSV